MSVQGIGEFQQQRKELIQAYSKKACSILMDENKIINAKSVAEKVEKLFEENGVDKKYLVDSQSIGRNQEYSHIWKTYKQEQRHKRNAEDKTTFEQIKEFELRDKYDMLTQDYIELLDEKKWIEHQLKTLKQENKRLSETIQSEQHGISTNNFNLEGRPIVEAIKGLVEEGATIIVKTEGKVIIKSYVVMDESKRFEFPEELWAKI